MRYQEILRLNRSDRALEVVFNTEALVAFKGDSLVYIYKQGGLKFMDTLKPFTDGLVEKFGRIELEKTHLFNLMSASGAPDDGSFIFTQFDLPGGEIEKFIRE
jgi:hypothetical protein